MTEKTWAGHPRGLATLFFTEMFERFSYYGMRGLLILFMSAPLAAGGLGFDARSAGAVYGLYTGCVYLMALPGGWIADRLIGQQKAVWYGGLLIAAGNFLMVVPTLAFFYLGLFAIIIGTGLLKPNISAIVGELYNGQPGERRDAGFSIFYMGINLGAFIAPYVAGTIGQTIAYRYGFAAAGVAMVLGLIQYRLTSSYLGNAGQHPTTQSDAERKRGWTFVGVAMLGLVGMIGLAGMVMNGLGIEINRPNIAKATLLFESVFALMFFGYVIFFGGLNRDEIKKVGVIAVFFLGAALFWAGFEQAGSTLNFFADRQTDRTFLGAFFAAGEHPSSWYQSANPIYIILLSPFFAWLWIALGSRNLNPSAPVKFGLGLLQLGLGFGVMIFAAELVLSTGGKVGPTWLLLTYLIHTTGELCLSPVGLSFVTKLAPPKFVGQMMGTWFLGASIGNLAAGILGGHAGAAEAAEMPGYFTQMMIFGIAAGAVMLLFSKPIKSMMGDVR